MYGPVRAAGFEEAAAELAEHRAPDAGADIPNFLDSCQEVNAHEG